MFYDLGLGSTIYSYNICPRSIYLDLGKSGCGSSQHPYSMTNTLSMEKKEKKSFGKVYEERRLMPKDAEKASKTLLLKGLENYLITYNTI